jgi:hypothetical protein
MPYLGFPCWPAASIAVAATISPQSTPLTNVRDIETRMDPFAVSRARDAGVTAKSQRRSILSAARRKHELVAVRVFHDRKLAPRLLLRLGHKFYAAPNQLTIRGLRVIACKGAGKEAADAIPLSIGSKENEPRIGFRDAHFYPPLLRVERLIGHQAKAELFRVEGECAILIPRGDADEFDASDHVADSCRLMAKMRCRYCQLDFTAILNKTILIMIMASTSFDPYFVDVLMPDLVGHDRSPAAFVVYLYLWRRASLSPKGVVQVSYATIAVDTGLSRITAQRAVALLRRRRLISSKAESRTSVPRYAVLRPWVGRIPAHA